MLTEYTVLFPDVVELAVAGRPDCSGQFLVMPDGQIDLGPAGTLFVEGSTVLEVARRVADLTGGSAEQVRCHVAEHRSRAIYVLGPVKGRPRAVPFAGPERVSDLLRRSGGAAREADANEARVVRRNVATGQAAETFQVDLAAVRAGDARTDVVLEPNDEVHVIETRQARLEKVLPAVLRR